MSIEYHIISRKTTEHFVYTTARSTAIFMLGKRISDWIIVKSITGKDKIFDMYSWDGDIKVLEQELDQL